MSKYSVNYSWWGCGETRAIWHDVLTKRRMYSLNLMFLRLFDGDQS